ncbi:MAG: hypothetical protein WAO08_35025 [Hyphomicrobiaceae bacterium]
MATKHSKYSKWGLAAIGGGVALTAIEVVGAVGYLISQDQPSYLVAGGAIITVIAAILPILRALLVGTEASLGPNVVGRNGPSAKPYLHRRGRANRRCQG